MGKGIAGVHVQGQELVHLAGIQGEGLSRTGLRDKRIDMQNQS